MLKVRKGDIVEVIKGEDRGKRGKVLKMLHKQGRAIVEGINLIKKHRRKTREDQPAGVVSLEASVSLANVMVFCKHCNRRTKVGFSVLQDGTKSRLCRACKEVI